MAFSIPEIPQQRGVAERHYGNLAEKTRCILPEGRLPKINKRRSKSSRQLYDESRNKHMESSPYEPFYQQKPV